MTQLPHYSLFTHTMLTVEQERALFCAWCEKLRELRENGTITASEYFAARWKLECWYAWIGNARDAAYCERMGIR